MRLSADRGDPSFGPDYHRAEVFLDGVKLDCCITADEEAGEVLVYRTDANGDPVIAANGGRGETEIRRGVVKIVIEKESA